MSNPQLSQAYYVERVAYITCYVLVSAFALSQLYGDWARKRLKMTVNRHHRRQHWLQLTVGLLSIMENLDTSAVFGIWKPWELALISGIAGSLYGFTLQISAYVLASGHYALVNQNPQWLGPVLALVPVVYALVHTPFLALAGYYGNSVFPFCDAVFTAIVLVVNLAIIDSVFLSIRRVVIESDRSAVSTAKILPQLMKIGRIVIATNVVLVAVSTYLVVTYPLYSYFIKPVPADGSHPFRGNPVFRLVALGITMWWAFHWPCPRREAPVTGLVTHTSGSRPSGLTTRGSISSTSSPASTSSSNTASTSSSNSSTSTSSSSTSSSTSSSAGSVALAVDGDAPLCSAASSSVVVSIDAPN